MSKWIRKPKIIRAFRWYKGKRIPKWLNKIGVYREFNVLSINGGEAVAEEGDYVFIDEEGKACAWNPEIFERIYERLDYPKRKKRR